jgi:hypothetical protein
MAAYGILLLPLIRLLKEAYPAPTNLGTPTTLVQEQSLMEYDRISNGFRLNDPSLGITLSRRKASSL